MCNIDKAESALKVAPYTGAWIEIDLQEKYKTDTEVAPYTGAWIEIRFSALQFSTENCRSLHGSVD